MRYINLLLLLLLSCPACYALSLAGSRPIHRRKAMISAGSALMSFPWDRNGFPEVFRRSWLHAGHLPMRCSLSSSVWHVSHIPSSSRPILFLQSLRSVQCPVLCVAWFETGSWLNLILSWASLTLCSEKHTHSMSYVSVKILCESKHFPRRYKRKREWVLFSDHSVFYITC